MTVATLLLLLANGILPLSLADSQADVQGVDYINNCCDLGYGRFTFSRRPKESGVYVIPNICRDDHLEVEAYCDTINGGGGWLVVQRRQDGSVDFNRTWVEYEDGFGELSGEFWYGLRALHCLTGQGGWEMRMDVKLVDGTKLFFQYEQFGVASAKDKYKVTVGGFQGTTTDPMVWHNEMNFTTKDSDNDRWHKNCAIDNSHYTKPTGGWWYNACHSINFNHYYSLGNDIKLSDGWHHAIFSEIKIRPLNCSI